MQPTTAPDQQIADFLCDLSEGRVLGAGGCSAALAAAMGAALVGMVARESPAWTEAGGAIAQAETLRQRLSALAVTDSAAYGTARELLARAETRGSDPDAGSEHQDHDRQLADALDDAAAVPLAIAEAAADVAALAGWAATAAGDQYRPDALVAVVLAEAAAGGAAGLVTTNLSVRAGDELAARAVSAAHAARDSRAQANQNR